MRQGKRQRFLFGTVLALFWLWIAPLMAYAASATAPKIKGFYLGMGESEIISCMQALQKGLEAQKSGIIQKLTFETMIRKGKGEATQSIADCIVLFRVNRIFGKADSIDPMVVAARRPNEDGYYYFLFAYSVIFDLPPDVILELGSDVNAFAAQKWIKNYNLHIEKTADTFSWAYVYRNEKEDYLMHLHADQFAAILTPVSRETMLKKENDVAYSICSWMKKVILKKLRE